MPIRVGVDGHALRLPRSGIGVYLSNLLATVLDGSSLRMTVSLPSSDEVSQHELEARSAEVRTAPDSVLRAYRASTQFGLPMPFEMLVGHQDVMVFPHYRRYPTLRTPSVVFIYDLVFHVHPETVARVYLSRLRRHVLDAIRHADALVVISETVAAELQEAFPSVVDRVVVLPPGVPRELKERDAADRLPPHLDLSPGYVLHVGTLEPRKNILSLIEAHRQLPSQLRTDHPLVLVGRRGWSDERIVAAIDETPGVHHLSDVRDDELAVLYRHAAVVISLSLYEGFGLPLLEAMTAATPVVCSDIPIHHEVCGDAAIYVDPLEPTEAAGSLQQVLVDAELRGRLRERGRTRATRFTWRSTAESFVQLVRRIAN